VTCVWLEAGQRGGVVSSLFWCLLLRRISACGATDVLFGTEQPGLHRLYLLTRADLLYRGPVSVDGHDGQGWIFIKQNGSAWPVVLRMAAHRVRRRALRRHGRPARRPSGREG
jgi:hypothetical protein